MAFLLCMAVGLLSANLAFACSCGGGDMLDHMEHADVILLGHVIESEVGLRRGGFATLQVAAFWKGQPKRTVHVSTQRGWCSTSLQIGAWYLVFADKRKRDFGDELSTSLCHHNRLIASEDSHPKRESSLESLLPVLGEPIWGEAETHLNSVYSTPSPGPGCTATTVPVMYETETDRTELCLNGEGVPHGPIRRFDPDGVVWFKGTFTKVNPREIGPSTGKTGSGSSATTRTGADAQRARPPSSARCGEAATGVRPESSSPSLRCTETYARDR